MHPITKRANKPGLLSTLLLIIFCGIYIWLIVEHLKIQHSSDAFRTGFIWVLLTAAFEFILGRITGQSWEYLLESYNLAAGKLFLL